MGIESSDKPEKFNEKGTGCEIQQFNINMEKFLIIWDIPISLKFLAAIHYEEIAGSHCMVFTLLNGKTMHLPFYSRSDREWARSYLLRCLTFNDHEYNCIKLKCIDGEKIDESN